MGNKHVLIVGEGVGKIKEKLRVLGWEPDAGNRKGLRL